MYSFCQRAVHLSSICFELADSPYEPNVADKTRDKVQSHAESL